MITAPLEFAFCNVSVMPVHSEASHTSEQSTQLLFGERAEVLEVNSKGWARIRGAWDGYEGWCRESQLTKIPKKEFRKGAKALCATNAGKVLLPEGELWLPMGSELTGLKGSGFPALHAESRFKGKKLNTKGLSFSGEALKLAALHYLHAPYQWGGRTIAGIDCSGLTQMAFRMCNQYLPRDAGKQVNEGRLVDFLQNARCGDLAFFEGKEGKIVHVGLLLDNQNIIHATDVAGRVVIDRIDMGGIISVTLKKRTHQLRVVKRFVD